ncbi:hypothetical protein LP090_09470 [Moraxella bovis]|nr:hypothetical protein [Moraxella bovis]UYZ69167.1 hypothetical protein LP122_03510 [Moraxella bovis]UYZ71540.1 hypothetical protein LP089_03565 [Moraxella bovis]UYZ72546.1 hypothetical protein LP105_09095 [Moraxella bovis]UZA14835.1 hypothetical protein LP102_03505 [Moraxella bovis]UZA26803.1 hypothetical protein LP119_09335 [Moraxella bovis]
MYDLCCVDWVVGVAGVAVWLTPARWGGWSFCVAGVATGFAKFSKLLAVF